MPSAIPPSSWKYVTGIRELDSHIPNELKLCLSTCIASTSAASELLKIFIPTASSLWQVSNTKFFKNKGTEAQ